MKIQRATSGKSTQTWKLPFTRRLDSLQTEEKSNPMEQGNEKQSRWMVCLETLELIYMSPLRARQKTTLPLALKLWYNPSGENRSCSTPLHRTATPLPQTVSSRREPYDPWDHIHVSELLNKHYLQRKIHYPVIYDHVFSIWYLVINKEKFLNDFEAIWNVWCFMCF
jgi:hypothetical protein